MDDYDRIRELGRGSFGAAILVRRKTDQKQLVVKEVNLGSLSQKEIAEARKEANFLANLSHPNIVRYEGCLEKEKKLMIFMEFCEGGDLSEKIKKQNGVLFTEEIILDWFCQECFEVNVFFGVYNLPRTSSRIPTVELKIPGKSIFEIQNQNFGYIQVIVFDLKLS